MPSTIIIVIIPGCGKNLHLPAPKKKLAKWKITYQAAFDFNLLSPEIQEAESILRFKKKLDRIP